MASLKTVCAALVLISGGLGGCASIEKVLPQDGPTMLEIYSDYVRTDGVRDGQSVEADAFYEPPYLNEEPLLWEVRVSNQSNDTLDATFPELPNPRLSLYVFPHLATSHRTPVPGYTTVFYMYERAEFALPGEVRPVSAVEHKGDKTVVKDDDVHRKLTANSSVSGN